MGWIEFIVLVAVISLGSKFIVLRNMKRYTLLKPVPIEVTYDALDEDFRILIDEAIHDLAAFGFDKPLYFRWSRFKGEALFGALLLHRSQKTIARVSNSRTYESEFGYEITFFSQNRSDQWLATSNMSSDYELVWPDWVVAVDAEADTLIEQWERHQMLMKDTIDIKDANYGLLVCTKMEEDRWQKAVQSGLIRETRAGQGHATNKGAKRITDVLKKQVKALGQMDIGAPKPSRIFALTLDWERNSLKAQDSGWMKAFLFLGSILLFALAFGLSFDWRFAWQLTVVVLIHEAGHLLGMLVFGYRDTRILFLPLLGAATIGHAPDHISATKELIVYLLGPIPGIFLGYACLIAGAVTGWDLFSLGIIFLLVNYLNLVPIVPLDGGHIANLAVFQRYPKAQILFSVIGIVALVVMAFFLRSAIFVFLAVINLMQLKMIRVMTFMEQSLGQKLRGTRLSLREKVKRIVGALEFTYSKVPIGQRAQWITPTVQRLNSAKSSLSTFIVALLSYMVVSLPVLPVLALWAAGELTEYVPLSLEDRFEQLELLPQDQRVEEALWMAANEDLGDQDAQRMMYEYARDIAIDTEDLDGEIEARLALLALQDPEHGLEEAEVLIELAISRPDWLGEVLIGRAELLIKLDRPDEAQESYDAALARTDLRLTPDDRTLVLTKLVGLLMNRDNPKAQAAMTLLAQSVPEGARFPYWVELQALLRSQGSCPESTLESPYPMPIFFKEASRNRVMGWLEMMCHRPEQALAFFELNLSKTPNTFTALLDAAVAKQELGFEDEAELLVEHARALSGEDLCATWILAASQTMEGTLFSASPLREYVLQSHLNVLGDE